MRYFLGIDTSNYTTSAAVYDSGFGEIRQIKRALPVKTGERGLRQSDAVFHHTVQLPQVLEELFDGFPAPDCIGVSTVPEKREGSYMPCFLAGECAARSAAAAKKIPLHRFSHQEGHIASALYSAGRLDLLGERFFAFHVSGGTTALLLVTKSDTALFDLIPIASSRDLKAGQAVDRIGVKLGLAFPAGKELDRLSANSGKDYFTGKSCKLKDGDCSLSGLENKAYRMLENGGSEQDTARFVFDSIALALHGMYQRAAEKYGELTVLFSGGVSSNTTIRQRLGDTLPAVFAAPEFSRDNAAGAAILAYLEEK